MVWMKAVSVLWEIRLQKWILGDYNSSERNKCYSQNLMFMILHKRKGGFNEFSTSKIWS